MIVMGISIHKSQTKQSKDLYWSRVAVAWASHGLYWSRGWLWLWRGLCLDYIGPGVAAVWALCIGPGGGRGMGFMYWSQGGCGVGFTWAIVGPGVAAAWASHGLLNCAQYFVLSCHQCRSRSVGISFSLINSVNKFL
jgi:hypothetical protein